MHTSVAYFRPRTGKLLTLVTNGPLCVSLQVRIVLFRGTLVNLPRQNHDTLEWY